MPLPDATVNAITTPFDRDGLYAILDNYLAALANRNPRKVPWASRVRYTENNVALMVGDGAWNTATGYGSYDLRFADPLTGQVGMFGLLDESGTVSPFTLRLGIDGGRVTEVEMIVVREADEGFKLPNPKFEAKPVLNEILPARRQVPRERMISIANGYFETLQLNDGAIFTHFHPDCNRVENGVQTTNNPDFPLFAIAKLGCEEQLRLGNYRFDDRVRGRRFPLIDEERGLVLATAFIDHTGRLADYQLTDGSTVQSPIRRPHSFYMLELFKIADGAIEQIEANLITVPYHMPSPWDQWFSNAAE